MSEQAWWYGRGLFLAFDPVNGPFMVGTAEEVVKTFSLTGERPAKSVWILDLDEVARDPDEDA